jgi:hypothetical protein
MSDRSWINDAMRWGQINIREIEPPDLDVAWWEDFWRRLHLDGITLNAGGLVAYYPTQLADHHRSRWLGERDLFGELVAAAKRCNMRVLGRIDPGESYEDVYYRHPDWFAVDTYGRPLREPGVSELYVPCMNGPYYWEFVPEIMREILGTYDVDGIFCSEWNGRGRICHCPRCRQLFKATADRDLPAAADPADMAWKQWVLWHERRLEDLSRHWDELVRALKPAALWMGNHSDRAFLADLLDMINVDNQSRRGDQPLWAVGEQGKKMRALTRGKKPYFHIFSSNSYSRHVAKPEAESRLYFADAVLADSRPWFTIIGGVQNDRRQFGPLEAMYRWHHAHEPYLRGRQSLAQVAIAFYNRDRFVAPAGPDGDAFRGMYYALLRGRIPFDLVHVARMDNDGLAPYKVIVLPNIAALSDGEAEIVRRFVARGGAVVATHETGRYDEWGQPRAAGALDDVLGVAQRWPRIGPLSHSYSCLHPPHALLAGLEETLVTLNSEYVCPVQPAPGTPGSVLTLIPPYPTYPPEAAFSRTGDSGLPLLLLTGGASAGGRVAYWPGNVDVFVMATNSPDHCRLLSNTVRWAFAGDQPAEVVGPGLIEMHPYRQEGNLQVHLVNFTNPDCWRAPVHELVALGAQRVRMRVPPGQHVEPEAQCLVSGRTLPVREFGEWAEAQLPDLLDHEIIVFDLAA